MFRLITAILLLLAPLAFAQDPKVAVIVSPGRPSKLLTTILSNHGYTIITVSGNQNLPSILQNLELLAKLWKGKEGSLFFYHANYEPSQSGFTPRELIQAIQSKTWSIWINACSPLVLPDEASYSGVISSACKSEDFAQALTDALRMDKTPVRVKDIAARMVDRVPQSRAGLQHENSVVLYSSDPNRTRAALDKQPEAKDDAEHTLLVEIAQAKEPEARLAKLNQWQRDYLETEFADKRRQALLATFVQLHMSPEALLQARELLAYDRTSAFAVLAMSQVLTEHSTIDPWEAYSVANRWLWEIDQSFADHEFLLPKLGPEVRVAALNVLGNIAMQYRLWELAESHFTSSLKLIPNQGVISYRLSSVIGAQRNVGRYPEWLFHLARAAYFDGPGSLPATARDQVLSYLQKLYTSIQCNTGRPVELAAQAKASALPPEGFTMKIYICHDAPETPEEREARKFPDQALWNDLKSALTGAGGQRYFDDGMKGATIPGGIEKLGQKITRFKGHVISASPAINPKVLVVSVYSDAANVTLTLSEPIRGRVRKGAQVEFQGNATSFVKDPFMLSFDVDIADFKLTARP